LVPFGKKKEGLLLIVVSHKGGGGLLPIEKEKEDPCRGAS